MAPSEPQASKLRIVHVFRAPLGGLFRHVVDLAAEQSARGHDIGMFFDSSGRCPRVEAALARVRRIAEETAAAAGATVAVRTQLSYPVLVNDPACADAVVRAARTLLPDAQVQPQFPPLMVSEDFAYYAQRVPAALWFVGLREAAAAAPGLHHPQFDFNDAVIKPVVMLHCGIARQAGKPVRQ